jgi:hypothetical protein
MHVPTLLNGQRTGVARKLHATVCSSQFIENKGDEIIEAASTLGKFG